MPKLASEIVQSYLWSLESHVAGPWRVRIALWLSITDKIRTLFAMLLDTSVKLFLTTLGKRVTKFDHLDLNMFCFVLFCFY